MTHPNQEQREAYVQHDRCPNCRGELDTGWECGRCGYDARELGKRLPKLDSSEEKEWLEMLNKRVKRSAIARRTVAIPIRIGRVARCTGTRDRR